MVLLHWVLSIRLQSDDAMREKSRGTLAEMAARYRRPDWVRRLNLMGESVGGAERMQELDQDQLNHRLDKPTPVWTRIHLG